MDPKVIYKDDEILVLDKPAGMTVNRADTTKKEVTVQDWVENQFSIFNSAMQNQFSNDEESDFFKRAGIVHRIDKETSGILVVAKTPEAFENLQKQFKERKVKKTYFALVHGKVEPEEGEIRVPIGRLPWNRKRFGVITQGKEAVTKYKVLRILEVRNEKWDPDLKLSHFSLLEICPETGRTHQIRVHLKYINHPVFGDSLYAGRKTARNDRKLLTRFFLHAAKISFLHPRTGELVVIESLLPDDLKEFLQKLGTG